MDAEVVKLHKQGRSVHDITSHIFDYFDGPSRWENVRDRIKELFPNEHVKGDSDSPHPSGKGLLPLRSGIL